MEQTTRRDAPCWEASQGLQAPLITPAGAAAVQQQALSGQTVAAAGIAKVLFFLCVVIYLIMVVLGLRWRRSV